MEKEQFFSKFNIKDYNNELELVLEKKPFSEETKNILLNILYKMEAGYDDYNKVKVDTRLKKDVLEEFIKIIQKKCKEVELVKPKINEETILGNKRYEIEKNKVISYPNEKSLFYALCRLQDEKFKINKEYTVIGKPLENLINMGYKIEQEELIRDFDGWSWTIVTGEIENYIYNLVYQNIKNLLGEKYIEECITNMNKIDFLDKLEKEIDNLYNEEIGNKIKESIYIISIIEDIKNDNVKQEKLIKEKEKIEKQLKIISNKKEYLQNLANNKKQIREQIRKIDEVINNDSLLKRNFKELSNNKESKIFSLSEYIDELQEKRKNLIKKLRQCSNLMKPMNYVKNKFNLEKKINLLNKIDFESNIENQENSALIELQINFLKAIKRQIGKTENKKKIIDYIYMFRYYKLLYVNQEKQIKDIEPIREQLVMAEKYLITRACNLKVINIISHNIEKNYEIISKILESNIIDLDELNIELQKKDNKTVLNIYDDNMIDKSIEYSENEDMNIKPRKKIKLFV